jgi:uncharacterized protein (DUF2236 family)
LVDTATLIYRRYVGDFSAEEEEQYYQESKAIARLFKILESLIPPAVKDLRPYMHHMIERGPARASDTARELAEGILRPQVPLVPAAVFDMLNLVTIGLLPPTLRAGFGLEWGSARQVLLDASSGVIRMMLPLLPDLLRAVPAARAAERLLAHGGRPFRTG